MDPILLQKADRMATRLRKDDEGEREPEFDWGANLLDGYLNSGSDHEPKNNPSRAALRTCHCSKGAPLPVSWQRPSSLRTILYSSLNIPASSDTLILSPGAPGPAFGTWEVECGHFAQNFPLPAHTGN
jgi:hypothetical protein